ncbi:retrovirus-related Pol polyprotein from transposon 17.6 [Ixodes scapularis]
MKQGLRATSPAVRVLASHVNLPPRSSVFVPVGITEAFCGEVLLEGSLQLLLGRGIGVARGVAELQDGRTVVLVTNFRNEAQHLTKGAAVGQVEELRNTAEVAGITDESSPPQQQSKSLAQLDIDPMLPGPKRGQRINLLAEYRDCFATSSKVRQTAVAKHRIVTKDDARPVHRSPYRVSAKKREVIQEQVQEMLNDDIIQPSSSPWASPVVLVKKKDGTLRFCVDYRQLNAVTKKDVYPLPRIDDTLDRLRHSRYFSSMDLKSGYWQIEVDERDREKTAFVTPDGLYEFKLMPFGLCTAPATFQRVMDTVLAGLKWQSCLVYLDDVFYVEGQGCQPNANKMEGNKDSTSTLTTFPSEGKDVKISSASNPKTPKRTSRRPLRPLGDGSTSTTFPSERRDVK